MGKQAAGNVDNLLPQNLKTRYEMEITIEITFIIEKNVSSAHAPTTVGHSNKNHVIGFWYLQSVKIGILVLFFKRNLCILGQVRSTSKFMMGTLTEISSNKIFGGFQKVFSHESKCLGCVTKFGVFLPPQAEERKLPVVYWLSGLTCSESNFIEKSGAQKYAFEHGVIVVNPDTSPRNLNIAGDSDSWDFGVGAGFYVDAIQAPWSDNYKMYSYVTSELIQIITDNFPILVGKQSIMGHSMGGHGALISALKNPGLYKSVSAFSPICNPSECPWGIKAFNGYLGPKESGEWSQWDATELVKTYNGPPQELFIDQGSEDNFLRDKQLLPENLIEACKTNHIPVIYKKREGYNHSYYYIASFIEEHFRYHSEHLQK